MTKTLSQVTEEKQADKQSQDTQAKVGLKRSKVVDDRGDTSSNQDRPKISYGKKRLHQLAEPV